MVAKAWLPARRCRSLGLRYLRLLLLLRLRVAVGARRPILWFRLVVMASGWWQYNQYYHHSHFGLLLIRQIN
uniref:Putative secreted peptide n=1 Tax=Anopheles braziliensis TaxID=58242 RepID=A0A2M3ZU24_9DIPT